MSRYEVIYEVGDVVKVKDLAFDNDMGGTAILDGADMTAKITKKFYDEECGWRCVGELVQTDEVARLRKLGATEFKPKMANWNPAKVYFDSGSITGTGVLEAKPGLKRPDAMVIADLRRVDNALSPENLTCDGELSERQVAQRLRELMAEQAKLVKELGRRPTDAELAWPRP